MGDFQPPEEGLKRTHEGETKPCGHLDLIGLVCRVLGIGIRSRRSSVSPHGESGAWKWRAIGCKGGREGGVAGMHRRITDLPDRRDHSPGKSYHPLAGSPLNAHLP
jgi:hypothetical protein